MKRSYVQPGTLYHLLFTCTNKVNARYVKMKRSHVPPGILYYTSTSYNIPAKQLAAFPHRLIAHCWKTNDACHYDFRQTSERMLAELRFKLTTHGLTARVKADIKVKHTTMVI